MIIAVSDSFGAIEASALIPSEGGQIADSAPAAMMLDGLCAMCRTPVLALPAPGMSASPARLALQ